VAARRVKVSSLTLPSADTHDTCDTDATASTPERVSTARNCLYFTPL
jgi:hypothetical protein